MTEKEFLKGYDSSKYPKPSYTADILVFGRFMEDGKESLRLLLIRRGGHPFKGCLACPGGFVEQGESAEEAASRELMEETGLLIPPEEMTQFHTFSRPGRDPRGWTISTAFIQAIDPYKMTARAGDDAKEAIWFDIVTEHKPDNEGHDIVTVSLKSGDNMAKIRYYILPDNGFTDIPRLHILESDGLAFDHGEIIAYAHALTNR